MMVGVYVSSMLILLFSDLSEISLSLMPDHTPLPSKSSFLTMNKKVKI